jgi:hypothetical protein
VAVALSAPTSAANLASSPGFDPTLEVTGTHPWARWDAFLYSPDPDVLFEEFRQRGASFVTELSFVDDGL